MDSNVKYIIILLLIVIAIFGTFKKLFKLTITVLLLGALYYLYTMFF